MIRMRGAKVGARPRLPRDFFALTRGVGSPLDFRWRSHRRPHQQEPHLSRERRQSLLCRVYSERGWFAALPPVRGVALVLAVAGGLLVLRTGAGTVFAALV